MLALLLERFSTRRLFFLEAPLPKVSLIWRIFYIEALQHEGSCTLRILIQYLEVLLYGGSFIWRIFYMKDLLRKGSCTRRLFCLRAPLPMYSLFKGTVSRELRLMLLYIIQKLFSRPIVASHKIYILLKGQSAINKKPFSVS